MVKEELQVKKWKGINVLLEVDFKFKYIFYRKERIKKIHSKLKIIPIKKNYGWCDDINSKSYNKFVKFPFKGSAEKLYIKENIYDIIVVINYNLKSY